MAEEVTENYNATDEIAALTNLFQILGGVLVITISMFPLFVSILAMHLILGPIPSEGPSLIQVSVSIMLPLGSTALVLAAVYWALPIRSTQVYDALLQGAGLILLVYPFMTVKSIISYDEPSIVFLGIETSYWFIYSVIGFVFLIQPRMMKSSHLRGYHHMSLPTLGLLLSILIAVLTFLQISEGKISGTIYSMALISSFIVVMISTTLYALLPDEFGIKTVSFS